MMAEGGADKSDRETKDVRSGLGTKGGMEN